MLTILTGPVHSGKTSLLRAKFDQWKKRDPAAGGFLSPVVRKEGKRLGYDLLDLSTGKTFPFLRLKGKPDWEAVGPFFVIPRTLDRARAIVRRVPPNGHLIVDELGPLELRGGGLWQAVSEALSRPSAGILVVIRAGILDSFLDRLRSYAPVVLDAPTTIGSLLSLISDTPERRREILKDGRLRSHLVVMVNGTHIGSLGGLDTLLAEGDTVAVFPFLAGG